MNAEQAKRLGVEAEYEAWNAPILKVELNGLVVPQGRADALIDALAARVEERDLLIEAQERIRELEAAVEELATAIQGEANREGSVYLCEIAKKYGKPSKWEEQEEEPEEIVCDDCGKTFPISEATTLNAYDGAGELEQVHLCPECATKNEERGLE